MLKAKTKPELMNYIRRCEAFFEAIVRCDVKRGRGFCFRVTRKSVAVIYYFRYRAQSGRDP
jgi:hypothetical protein